MHYSSPSSFMSLDNYAQQIAAILLCWALSFWQRSVLRSLPRDYRLSKLFETLFLCAYLVRKSSAFPHFNQDWLKVSISTFTTIIKCDVFLFQRYSSDFNGRQPGCSVTVAPLAPKPFYFPKNFPETTEATALLNICSTSVSSDLQIILNVSLLSFLVLGASNQVEKQGSSGETLTRNFPTRASLMTEPSSKNRFGPPSMLAPDVDILYLQFRIYFNAYSFFYESDWNF